ncbi:probable cytochrome P450 CYP44 isoform X1 [Crassostrea angulata]|uniref:probable cytochrome P450 CYP44 isoform X1 n=2 Tax=Magallana angulata TaxID=2784310 RepID=UPI0022B0D151|nr:probable cytochrome P450 CYP44 isoform X1 [Crassostrea angulata]
MKSRASCVFQFTTTPKRHAYEATTPSIETTHLSSKVVTNLSKKNDKVISEIEIRHFDEIPGPSGIYQLPYLGLLLQMKPFTKYAKDNMQQRVLNWTQKYGPICKQRLGNDWYVFLTDPNDVEKVFRNDRKFPFRGVLPLTKVYTKRTNASPGLTGLNDEEWYTLRKSAQRAILRQKAVYKYLSAISVIADDFVDKFRGQCQIDDVLHHLMEFSTESAGRMCFGVRLGCISKPEQTSQTETMKHVETFLDCFGNQFYVIPWFKLFRSPFYRRYEKSADYLKRQTEQYIRAYKERIQSSGSPEVSQSLLSDLSSDSKLTTADIQRTLIDVFVGGIDSATSSITILLFNLAKNLEKQDLLYDELEKHVPKFGPIDGTILCNLNYLKACIKESMRLVFPVPVGTARTLDKDIILRGYRIPAHTNFVFCSGITCLNSKYFEAPEQFVPERWLRKSDNYTPIHPFSYIPFGYGPRKCIGQTFAETEISMCAAKLLRNFRLTLPEGSHEIKCKDKTFRTPVTPVSFLVQNR